MACTTVVIGKSTAIVCGGGRLHRLTLGNRYIWLEYHSYLGPTFWSDRNCTKPYYPIEENDPIWPIFNVWLNKARKKGIVK